MFISFLKKLRTFFIEILASFANRLFLYLYLFRRISNCVFILAVNLDIPSKLVLLKMTCKIEFWETFVYAIFFEKNEQ